MPEAKRKDTELLNRIVAYANDERSHNEFRSRALLNEAKSLYERCNSSEAVAALGIMHNVLGNAEEAVNKFRAALALSDDGDWKQVVRRNFGVALNRSGDPIGALQQVRAAWDECPNTPQIAADIADYCFISGRVFEARDWLSIYDELDNENKSDVEFSYDEIIPFSIEVLKSHGIETDAISKLIAAAVELMRERQIHTEIHPRIMRDEFSSWIGYQALVSLPPIEVVQLNRELSERLSVLPSLDEIGTAAIFNFRVDEAACLSSRAIS